MRDSLDTSANRTFECVVGTLSDTVHPLKSYAIPSSWKTFVEAKITRKGNTITWQLDEINGKHSWHWSTTMAELGAMEITGVTIWPQKYSNNADLDIELTDTKFTWENETTVTDIPNLFADGDVVTIDTQNKKILVNGVEDRGLQEIGNHWDDFYLTPGNNTITVDGSSWATQPTITVNYQEAYV
nr:phage tail domain-containing protein [Lacticaseibacillus nasuensis]